jgi:hypothetical protein
MTPIRQIEGLPLSGGLIAGVQLEPDGLAFYKPVTLTIGVPKGYDTGAMTGFGYHGQGEGFYMMPAKGDGSTITLTIFSFSGHGAGSGTQADFHAQANAQATTWYEDYQQRQAEGAKTEDEKKVEEMRDRERIWLKGFYEQLKGLLKQAAQTEGLVDPGTSNYMTWRYEVEFLHMEEDFARELEELRTLLIKALRASFDRASNKCSGNKDITQLAKMQKRIYELAWMLDEGYTLESKLPEFERCARFRVKMESKLKWELETQMDIEGDVSGEAILRWDDNQYDGFKMLYKGKGEARFKKYTIGFRGEAEEIENKCNVDVPEKPGRLYSAGRIYWMNLGTANPRFTTIVGVYVTGMSQKMSKWTCSTGEQGEYFTLEVPTEMPTWYSGFRKLHESEKMKFMEWEDEYYFPGPLNFISVQNPGQYERQYSGSEGPNQVTEEFSLNVFAAPGQ